MNSKGSWSVFTDTGDPMGYLLYRSAQREKRREKKQDEPGNEPRAED